MLLFVRGRRAAACTSIQGGRPADAFTWVFFVPALDEELTIRDSVERLTALPLQRRRIVVIDDGSSDRTAEILRQMEAPGLHVIRRKPPDARLGKAAALNHAYRELPALVGGADPEHVVVAVVDADGRLHAEAPHHAAGHFSDLRVGGVQSLVRIYNRRHLLTWCQNVEFSVYGHLFQAGRNDWGTAGMGGNGQFNRLSALHDVADATGPWRDRLTEDQDLGLRLLTRGWESRQELRATVDQQGLSALRPLLRQRTRWSQGNLQALGLIGEILRSKLSLGSRIELVAYLLMPLWQAVIGVSFALAVVLAVVGQVPFWAGGPSWQLLFFYLLAFGGTILGCVAARGSRGARAWIVGFLIGNVYTIYTWLLWPVLLRSVARQLTSRHDWSKTRREPIEAAGTPRPDARPHAPGTR